MKRFNLLFGILILILIMGACSNTSDEDAKDTDKEEPKEEGQADNDLEYPHTPNMDDLDPDDPKTEAILYGEEVFNETNVVMPENVGNELSCQSCHADGGLSISSSLVGVAGDYPQYRPRENVTFTLEDRVNGCMIRSMNGEMIDYDSEEMRGMIAYMTYLSEGYEIGADRPWAGLNSKDELPEPNVDNGEELYESKNCLTCHATDGSGTGANSGPALWGQDSFNDGAGLGRLTKLTGYIQNNMPVGNEYELSDQEATDLAAFILMQDRPVFDGHDEDFPEMENPPTDIITEDRREEIREGTFDWSEIEAIKVAE
ncbi:MAG TPA: c-type cytochrome [Pseudogracilibacillus sp.]|nr:c-type cytochrome [Pseudogracilibacillus sp.]